MKLIKGNITRVLKAPTEPVLDFASLQPILDTYGLYASDKKDGIRCITHPVHGVVSQKMKAIPNLWINNLLFAHCPIYLDGELVALDCEGNECDFNDTQSAVMSEDGQPSFRFYVFDCFENIYLPYAQRIIRAKQLLHDGVDYIEWLPHFLCRSVQEIEDHERKALWRGNEGLMLNHPRGWYKEGRSTLSEGYLLKVKRFTDDEAIVFNIEEEMENCNLATRDAGGLQKRSKHKANLKGKGMVGKLHCHWRGKVIKIGSGMTQIEKYSFWRYPYSIIGKKITFKYQAHGMKDLPRAPIFKGIRYD